MDNYLIYNVLTCPMRLCVSFYEEWAHVYIVQIGDHPTMLHGGVELCLPNILHDSLMWLSVYVILKVAQSCIKLPDYNRLPHHTATWRCIPAPAKLFVMTVPCDCVNMSFSKLLKVACQENPYSRRYATIVKRASCSVNNFPNFFPLTTFDS